MFSTGEECKRYVETSEAVRVLKARGDRATCVSKTYADWEPVN
jgi:hypothetical protein